jgi:LCP family protein required for cell wall assembly
MEGSMRNWIVLVVMLWMGLNGWTLTAQSEQPYQAQPVTWDGQSRFNILVLGMDRRPGARDNLNARTDVVMIVSFDPASRRLGILSIPRDMHLAVIGGNKDLMRINTLLVEGEAIQENYGPHFAMEAIQLNLGMYIDAYIAFDFVAFSDFVDLIGGVTVNVPYAISDPTFPDMNYGYDPFYISAGLQQLNGHRALQYARTRHGDNDYLRGQRQLQVVLGIRERLGEVGVVQGLLADLPQLVSTFQGHFYSNMEPQQIAFLGMSMMLLGSDEIVTGSLNEQYSFDYVYAGERVRVPDRELLALLLTDIFGEDYWQ